MSDSAFPPGAALIVGGTGGIGRVIARQLAKAGTPIAITYRAREDEAAEVARELENEGVTISVHRADVTDPASIATARDAAVASHGRIHTAVFAAGRFPNQLYVSQYGIDQYRAALDVETMGFFNVVQAMLGHFREGGGGSFVHLGSAGALAWAKKDGLSVVPKAANDALVKGIAVEEGRFGIRANTVLVGVIEAGMFLKFQEQGVFDEAWKSKSLERQAIKRFGKPEEIGDAVAFLASDKASYITGQVLSVTGGFGL